MPQPAAPAPTSATEPTPQRILETSWGFGPSQVLAVAADLGLFTRIAEGHTTPEALAEALGVPARGVRMLVDVLVGMGFLDRAAEGEDRHLSLAPDVEAFLVQGKPAYVGDFVALHGRRLQEAWGKLGDVVRTGVPARQQDDPEAGLALWHELVECLFPVNYRAATQAGAEIARRHPEGEVRLLDVAAGSGVWGLGAATATPRIRVTALDLPEIVGHAKRHAERMGLGERFEVLPGDLRETDLGRERFEVAMLGHICHSEGPQGTRALLDKVARALVPGGTVVVAEFVPDAGRNGPLTPLLFAVNMLVNTTEGDTYTLDQLAGWLREAGFADVGTLATASQSPLIVARKA